MKILGYFILICSLFSCANNPGQSGSLKFKTVYKVDFENIMSEAKKTNKIIFVDVFATWCGPCKYMDKTAFKNADVIKKFEKDFVNYKVDGEEYQGMYFARTYKVGAYPTYLFLNPNGTVILRFEGSCSPQKLIELANQSQTKMVY